jgi:hypothetical protein
MSKMKSMIIEENKLVLAFEDLMKKSKTGRNKRR